MNLKRYNDDPRLALVPGERDFQQLFLYAADKILEAQWHWLAYHFSKLPPIPIARRLIECCLECDRHLPGTGRQYVERIAAINTRERNEADYNAILQILAEILCLCRIIGWNWSEAPQFEHEPAGRTGQRPEILLRSGGRIYMFEVKAPSLLDHVRQRALNEWQLPGRMLPVERIRMLAREVFGQERVTLPRDNPIKDFLISADRKFADFAWEEGANVLVIVWDDHVYEPISVLINPASGLLTEHSYYRGTADEPIGFDSIDGVIVVRHLNYFSSGLAERRLVDRTDAFDFGGADALPNVFFQMPEGRPVPLDIISCFRALDYRDERLQHMAEYRPMELVFWI